MRYRVLTSGDNAVSWRGRTVRSPLPRRIPDGLELRASSQWKIYSRRDARNLLRVTEENADVVRFWRTTTVPDESFAASSSARRGSSRDRRCTLAWPTPGSSSSRPEATIRGCWVPTTGDGWPRRGMIRRSTRRPHWPPRRARDIASSSPGSSPAESRAPFSTAWTRSSVADFGKATVSGRRGRRAPRRRCWTPSWWREAWQGWSVPRWPRSAGCAGAGRTATRARSRWPPVG